MQAKIKKFWRIGTRSEFDGSDNWPDMRDGAYISIGYSKLPDLSGIKVDGEAHDKIWDIHVKAYGLTLEGKASTNKSRGRAVKSIERFLMGPKPGDIVVASHGAKALGIGIVGSESTYQYRRDLFWPHVRPIKWESLEEWELEGRWKRQQTFIELEDPVLLKAIRQRLGRGNHDWTSEECDAVVLAYFDMMSMDSRGEAFVKRQILIALSEGILQARSRQSIEYKFRNISSVLDSRGLKYLAGYVPATNVQGLLVERIDEFLASGANVFDPLVDPEQGQGKSGHDSSPPFDPSNLRSDDTRTFGEIQQRRGQQKFRKALLTAYEGRCQITKCSLPAVLESAHIIPYAGPDFNHISNGLLLRADIHTLFDLNLIGINPDSLEIRVAPAASTSPYKELHGRTLRASNQIEINNEALQLRWKKFSKQNRNSS